METTKFSLLKAVRVHSNGGRASEFENRMNISGQKEFRKNGLPYSGNIQLAFTVEQRAVIQATATGSGQENVSEDRTGLIQPVRSALVTVQAGATFLPGLVGNVKLPVYGGSTANWKGEGVTAVDGAGTWEAPELKPKRLTCYLDISKQFLLQDSTGAEEMLLKDLADAVAGKLEATIFGKEAGSDTQPAGLFSTAPSINGSLEWDNIVSLEDAVTFANSLKSGAYITNAAGRSILKRKAKVPNTSANFIESIGNGSMNGYPVLVTNHVAGALQPSADEQGIVFGDWSQLIIGIWSAVDITVDPFSRAEYDETRLTINFYTDAVTRYASALKTGSLKL